MSRVLRAIPVTPAPRVVGRLSRLFRAAAFWLAVGLPLAYLPILTGELDSPALLVVVFLGHVCSLYVGRTYRDGRHTSPEQITTHQSGGDC